MCVSVRLESGDDTDTWKIILDRSIDSVRTTRRTCTLLINWLVGWLVGCNQSIHQPVEHVLVVEALFIIYTSMYVMEESVGDSCHSHACNLMHAEMILGSSSPRIGIEARRRLVRGMSTCPWYIVSSFVFVVRYHSTTT